MFRPILNRSFQGCVYSNTDDETRSTGAPRFSRKSLVLATAALENHKHDSGADAHPDNRSGDRDSRDGTAAQSLRAIPAGRGRVIHHGDLARRGFIAAPRGLRRSTGQTELTTVARGRFRNRRVGEILDRRVDVVSAAERCRCVVPETRIANISAPHIRCRGISGRSGCQSRVVGDEIISISLELASPKVVFSLRPSVEYAPNVWSRSPREITVLIAASCWKSKFQNSARSRY
jgi:hypothetical protein